ncbi:hypothetical protein K505DRAFT_78949 [Melanomma pulvis-pyrius CBS 109.77]|uniref:DUF7708 domain-containing protein n=1 Tax=Melanomma pulvis-pyrius CBS 109.77 TaxID=1314802 RepID=A0A6A6X2Z3_9PLEO|nr:hypothetical protein K505DRAFT_78949 [Melanomma pulvis-pyrius CBS 109.77]
MVGDAATEYDSTHATLPWAGIRCVLQITVNDSDRLGVLVEGLARIAELICRYAVVEGIYLQGKSQAARNLESVLVKLYVEILSYLSKAKQYVERGTAIVAEAQLDTGLNDISKAENDVGRCMALVARNDMIRSNAGLENLIKRIDAPLQPMNFDLNNICNNFQASKRASIVQWLSLEPYIEHHKQATQGVLPGTGQ